MAYLRIFLKEVILLEILSDKIRYHHLYDIYKGLLTEKQKTYFEYYYLDDYSLSEIADMLEVSRNAVHDQVKKVLEHLDHYESTLLVYEKHQKRELLIKELESHFSDAESKEIIKNLEKLEE